MIRGHYSAGKEACPLFLRLHLTPCRSDTEFSGNFSCGIHPPCTIGSLRCRYGALADLRHVDKLTIIYTAVDRSVARTQHPAAPVS